MGSQTSGLNDPISFETSSLLNNGANRIVFDSNPVFASFALMPEPATTTLVASVNYPTGSTTTTRGKYSESNSLYLDITPKTG